MIWSLNLLNAQSAQNITQMHLVGVYLVGCSSPNKVSIYPPIADF